MSMLVRELIAQIQHASDSNDIVCIYNQETGERINIELIDSTIYGEIQLNIKG